MFLYHYFQAIQKYNLIERDRFLRHFDLVFFMFSYTIENERYYKVKMFIIRNVKSVFKYQDYLTNN